MKTILISLALLASTSSFAESGFFGCNGITDCSLLKTQAQEPADSGIGAFHALYTVNYKFSCNPGGYDSNIIISAGGNEITLAYSDEAGSNPTVSIQLSGNGPVTLRDSNPNDTRSAIFGPGCDLSLDVQKAPSRQQIDIWLTETANITGAINIQLPVANLESDIDLWYKANLADPEGTSGFLQTQIDALRAPGTTEADHTLATAFEGIIQGHPLDQVKAPITDAISILRTEYNKGKDVRGKLTVAKEGQSEAFNTAMKAAQKILEK